MNSLGWAVASLLFAALMGIVAWKGNMPQGVQMFCVLTAMLFTITGLTLFADFVAWRVEEHAYNVRKALAVTPQSEYLTTVSELTDAQLDFLRARTVTLRNLTSPNHPPVRTIICENLEVPADFAEEFLEQTGDYFPAVRDWPEGTLGRRYAQDLTALLKIQGYAEQASGNHPAKRTVDIDEIKRGLGLIL